MSIPASRILCTYSVEEEQTRIKGLVWEKDGWLLLYKRLAAGSFQWPRNEAEVMSLTDQQFRWLMEGLTIHPRRRVMEITPTPYLS